MQDERTQKASDGRLLIVNNQCWLFDVSEILRELLPFKLMAVAPAVG